MCYLCLRTPVTYLPGLYRRGHRGGGFSTFSYYSFKDFFNILECVVIPESQDFESFIPKPDVSLFVFLLFDIMLSTVELNYNPPLIANKVYNIFSDRLLPSELQSLQPVSPDATP